MLEQKLYTVADVAELTGLTSRTIRNYLKDGTLRGKKIGVQWRFTEEDINRLFSEVDAAGKKVIHPEDVISDFLKETKQETHRSCLVIDIPFAGDEQLQECLDRLKDFEREADDTFAFACEVLEGHQILRVAVAGITERIEEFAVRMKKI